MDIDKLNKMLSYMAFRIFKPLVVLFLRNSIPYQTASDWLKRVYVDTAFDKKEFRINPDKKQTKTRVAVLTGLSRVEIDRVLKIEKPPEVTEQKWNRATKVLSAWCSDEDYLQQGEPKILAIYGEHSFSSLVEKYSGGATMRSVLDELVNVKSVQVEGDRVMLIRQDYAQKPDKQKLINLEVSGLSTGALLDTLVFNENEDDISKKRYQKLVFHRSIPDSKINEAIEFIHNETDNLLVLIDNKLSELGSNPEKQHTSMIGLGAYYFEENEDEE